MKEDTKRSAVEETTIKIDRDDLIEYLTEKGYRVPDDAKVFVPVPGGGDWSNMDLDIGKADERALITVSWESVAVRNSH